MDVSFEMPGFEKLYSSTELHMDLAKKALDNLYDQYPEIFLDGKGFINRS